MKIHKSLRIDEDVVEWLQLGAKSEKRSFNNHVGNVLENAMLLDKSIINTTDTPQLNDLINP